MDTAATAVTASNQYVDVVGGRLAYRSIGEGTPIVLCMRFRGNIDLWDPAVIPQNSFEDEVVLFFEPRSSASREAARGSVERIAQRTEGRSVPVPADWAAAFLGSKPRNPIFPADPVLAALKTTTIPVLHVDGDHDISFPVKNWYARNQQLPTVQL
jgi:hypothetical protein